ncbi:flagellar assembly protein FliW [Frigoribacterium sp. VKM Ac-2836]|uniref:flagellar assembly protein FliW n=1 Tax=Frigoribacterium sp. VKM Ac-2836 TaxID=2739014 RepID=UPI001C274F2C|nr:flagellar assembly protein FliW [Frigoribacterium sp. VKM Ac-2836]
MSAQAARDVVGSVVSFVAPPFGLEPLVAFSLERVEGAEGLYALRSTDSDVRLFVLDAAVHLPDYSPVVSDEQTLALDLQDAAEALLLVVATPASTGMTVNLLAPIVVNVRTGAGAQLILEGQDWPLRAELSPRS